MQIHTKQEEFWLGEFGKQYTERNSKNDNEWDDFYRKNYGLTKLEMNELFIGDFERDYKILEAGCNYGLQLRGLQRMGFNQLYGIELQPFAVEKAKALTSEINIIQGSGFDIPFKNNYFDIVCTHGVLIHISPDNLEKFMDEMHRCSKKYIWGFEYFSEKVMSVNYRGNEGFLWKADYAQIFLERFPDLKLLKKEFYPYVSDSEKGNVDCMYLLEKIN
ncbi:MAG: pseudaminic acid biosynthesis-associated methylase [Chitinophagaceae bacterium]